MSPDPLEERTVDALLRRGLLVRRASPLRIAGRIAAAIALFGGGLVLGRWSGPMASPSVSAPAPVIDVALQQPALEIQDAASAMVAALARLSQVRDTLDRSLGQEVTVAGMRGVAAQLLLLDPSGTILTQVRLALGEEPRRRGSGS